MHACAGLLLSTAAAAAGTSNVHVPCMPGAIVPGRVLLLTWLARCVASLHCGYVVGSMFECIFGTGCALHSRRPVVPVQSCEQDLRLGMACMSLLLAAGVKTSAEKTKHVGTLQQSVCEDRDLLGWQDGARPVAHIAPVCCAVLCYAKAPWLTPQLHLHPRFWPLCRTSLYAAAPVHCG